MRIARQSEWEVRQQLHPYRRREAPTRGGGSGGAVPCLTGSSSGGPSSALPAAQPPSAANDENALRSLLEQARLAQYYEAFVEKGWDDAEFIAYRGGPRSAWCGCRHEAGASGAIQDDGAAGFVVEYSCSVAVRCGVYYH